MQEKNLPEAFLENMKQLLGEEYDSFLASYSKSRKNALRLNRLKIFPQEFEKTVPFPVERVPWTDNGYYVDYRDAPGRHPWYRAGVYYLQEPSAMAPAQILPVEPGHRVLDLCAAPGGKATELGARLKGEGLLVANEISPSRARALERNIELFGIRNCVVTNEAPERLAARFPEYFDRILVDAPCSGEGMFRKDAEAARLWSMEKVLRCAGMQREILRSAVRMLCPGGYMVYSTCTFEPVENELAVWEVLSENEDLELIPIPCTQGREAFSKAYSFEKLRRKGYEVPGQDKQDQDVINQDKMDLTKSVRIWPHRAEGEGHYIALLRKKDGTVGETAAERWSALDDSVRDQSLSGAVHARAGKRKEGRKRPQKSSGLGNISKQERKLIGEFLERYVSDRDIENSRYERKDAHIYRMPEDCPDIYGLKFLRAGLYLGELKKNRFEPSHELALALPAFPPDGDDIVHEAQNNDRDGMIDDGARIVIRARDERLSAFLRGEPVRLSDERENGWRLVCADRWPVGWGKLVGGVLKNHIPAGWRSDR